MPQCERVCLNVGGCAQCVRVCSVCVCVPNSRRVCPSVGVYDPVWEGVS